MIANKKAFVSTPSTVSDATPLTSKHIQPFVSMNDMEGEERQNSYLQMISKIQEKEECKKSFHQSVQDFPDMHNDGDTDLGLPDIVSNRLLVEMELGQQAMPKPLLSGYFTNQLNSVHQIQEVQKSLEDAKDLNFSDSGHVGPLDRIHETEEIPRSELNKRAVPKIKQSLTRAFSIENLKRYAGSHLRTPSERNKTLDDPMLIDKSRTPVNQTSLAHNKDTNFTQRQKRYLSQPGVPFQF